MKAKILIVIGLIVISGVTRSQSSIMFEDYNNQDIFNYFSGDWNIWNNYSSFSYSFDTTNCYGVSGGCLKLNYSVPTDTSWGGLWNSAIGKIDYLNLNLNLNDLFGELQNSSGNPSLVENVQVTSFSFYAKGNGIGGFDHKVKVEVKNTNEQHADSVFTISNLSGWTQYSFSTSQMFGIDLTNVKEIVFTIEGWRNSFRTSHLYFDNLSFETNEPNLNFQNLSDDEMLDIIAHRAFNYFLTFTDGTRGFVTDRSTFSDLVSVGGIGFQLASYCIGHQRGWANSDTLENRVVKILTKLSQLPMGPDADTLSSGYRGFFYHFLDANTGTRKDINVELSLYDTKILMLGILTCKEYFNNNPLIQTLAQQLYDAVEWDWMVDTNPGTNQNQFYLAWSPESGFSPYHVDGYTDEGFLSAILALGSNTHPVSMQTYNATSRHFGSYPSSNPHQIAAAWTGSLFNYFFAGCWLDLENRGMDKHPSAPVNIWQNNKAAIQVNRQFCIDHSDNVAGDEDDFYTTYSSNNWGLTACDNLYNYYESDTLSEYYAFGALPTQQNINSTETKAPHIGTIATYGAGSSIVFTPIESINSLRHFTSIPDLWNPLFGLGDAFSLDPHFYEIYSSGAPIVDEQGNLKIHSAGWMNGPWVNNMIMAIDVGPMLLSIENYRSNLIWDLLSQNQNISIGMDSVFGILEDHEFQLRVFLEGPFNGTDMNNGLINDPDFPLTQPYNTNPWNYSGNESVASIPNSDIVDWILVELRETAGDASTAHNYSTINRKAGFLLTDGSIVDIDGTTPMKITASVKYNLFVVLWHRNHLGVMSASPLTLSGGSYIYDFTDGANKTYGGSSGTIQIGPGIWGMIAGDGNGNGQVSNPDRIEIWKQQAGNAGYYNGDFNLDRQVNNQDRLNFWNPNVGKSCQVP